MRVKEMIQTHPHLAQADIEALVKCIEAVYECAQTCTSCADACLGEENLQMLVRCITRNLNCASICEATGQLLSRQTEADWRLIHNQLEVCAEACRLCGDECEKHASKHEHCRICAEACRRCEEACAHLMAIVSVPVAQ